MLQRGIYFLDLELEVSDGLGGQVHLDGGFVGLIVEVPDIDSVVLRDEDHTGAGRRESAAGVLRSTSVGRTENGLVSVRHAYLPDSEVEVVHGQD